MSKSINRRNLIKTGIGVAAGVAAGGVAQAQQGPLCAFGPTPPQTEGPFYPVNDQLDKDNDLVYVQGANAMAQGEVVYIHGQVTDTNCVPVPGALVEIWQACVTGRYNHPADPNTGVGLDPNFQYWGKTIADQNGEYIFRTIIPGAYPATPDWDRPPHIHCKVQKRGFHELTTQMYFGGHPLNATDRILQSMSDIDKRKVVVDFKPTQNIEYFGPSKNGRFNITLLPVV